MTWCLAPEGFTEKESSGVFLHDFNRPASRTKRGDSRQLSPLLQ